MCAVSALCRHLLLAAQLHKAMAGRDCMQGKHECHASQDGVKGETLLRWLKRQGVIQLGAEWHRHLYDLPAPPKQPSKATAAQRSMPPMQVSL